MRDSEAVSLSLMRHLLILLIAMVLMGCVPEPELQLSAAERIDCIKSDDPSSGVMIMSSFDEACLEYGRLQRFKGVWYLGFEESGFAEGARHVPLKRDLKHDDTPENHTWLYVDDNGAFDGIDLPERKIWCTRAIFLDFDGRKAVRRVPPPLDRSARVIKVEQVHRAKFVGYVSTTREGIGYRDCSESEPPEPDEDEK